MPVPRDFDLLNPSPSDLDEIEDIVKSNLIKLLQATENLRKFHVASPSSEESEAARMGKPHPLNWWIHTAYHFWVNVPSQVPPAVRQFWVQPAITKLWPRRLTIKALLRNRRVPRPMDTPAEITWHAIAAARPGIRFMLEGNKGAHLEFISKCLKNGLPRCGASARAAVKEFFAGCRKAAQKRPEAYRVRPRSQEEVNEEVKHIVMTWGAHSSEPSSTLSKESPYQLERLMYEHSMELRTARRAAQKEANRAAELGKQVGFEHIWRFLLDQWPDVTAHEALMAVDWAIREGLLRTDPTRIEYRGKVFTFEEYHDLRSVDRPSVVLRIPATLAPQSKPASKGKRGRPPVEMRRHNKIVGAWNSGCYKTYAECAAALGPGFKEVDVSRAVDREKKRLRDQARQISEY